MRQLFLHLKLALLALLFCPIALASGSHYEQALQAYHEGKSQAAFIYLRNALDVQPRNLPAKILMGKLLLQRAFFPQAIREFEEALQYRADMNLIIADYATALIFNKEYKKVLSFADGYTLNRDSRYELLINKGTAYKKLELFELARQSLREAMSIKPSDVRAANSLAALEIDLGEFETAHRLLKQSLFQDASDHRTLHLQGQLYFNQENYEQAIASYQRALDLLPEDPVVQRSLIAAYVKHGQMTEARALLEKVTEATPEDPYIMLLSSWMLSLSQEDEESAELLDTLSKRVSLFSEDDFTNNPSLIFVTAVSSYLQGNTEQASKELNKYLTLAPGDIRAISLLANVYEKQDKKSEAAYLLQRHESSVIKNLELGLKLVDLYVQTSQRFEARSLLEKLNVDFPGEMDVVLRLVNILNQSGQTKQAQALLESAKVEGENNVRLDLAKGLIYLQNRDFSSALQVANLLLKQDPDNIEFQNFKSAVLIKTGKPAEAEVLIKNVLEARPNFYEAKFNLATVYKQQNKLKDAKEILEKLHDLQPSQTQVKVMLGQIYVAQGEPDKAIPYLEAIRTGESGRLSQQMLYDIYYDKGNFLEAKRVIDFLTDIYLFEPSYLFKKAHILKQLNKYEESKKQLGVLFGLANNDTRMLFDVAVMQRQIEDFEGAQKTLDKVLSIIPENLRVNIEQARLHIAANRISKAKEIAWSLNNKAPNEQNTLLLLGDIAYQEQNFRKAHQHYSQSLERDPRFNIVLLKLYQLAKNGVEPEAFTRTVQSIIDQYPNELWRQKLLADHYVNQSQHDNALAIYSQLIELEQFNSDPYVLNNLANIYLNRDNQKALEFARQAYGLNDTNSAILDTYGWALYQIGRLDDSLEMLRKAHAINSVSKTIRFHLANVLHKLNRNNEAKTELSYALKDSSGEPWYQQALELEKQL